jgi:hypothetical protein
MLLKIISRELASIEGSNLVTIAKVKALETLLDHVTKRELDEARKALGDLWSAVYARADEEALSYLDKTNVRAVRAAEQWQRIERTKRAMPYLIYQLGPVLDNCSLHLHWENTILPVDDPWWSSHMPPNSCGCTCWVSQVSKFEYQKIIASGKAKTEAPDDGVTQWTNKRTGEVESIPTGIDPSWNFNPGKGRNK